MDFARLVIVPILPDVVNDSTGIESAEIVEQARVPVVSRKRAKSRSYEAAIKIICKSPVWLTSLQIDPGSCR